MCGSEEMQVSLTYTAIEEVYPHQMSPGKCKQIFKSKVINVYCIGDQSLMCYYQISI